MMQFTDIEKMFFYSNTEYKSPVITLYFELTENIDITKLKKALEKALSVFKRMKSAPVFNKEGRIDIIENTNDVPVFEEYDRPALLGAKESNYYLFRLDVCKNKLKCSGFHGIADASFLNCFQKQVFMYYLQEKYGYDVTEYLISEEEASQKEYTESLIDRIEDYVKDRDDFARDKKGDSRETFFASDETPLLSTDANYVRILSWRADELKELVHKYQVTPLVLFHTLLANVNNELYDVRERIIRCGFAVDMRNKLGSKSFLNFSAEAETIYENEWIKKPFEEQLQLVKESVKEALEMDNLARSVLQREKESSFAISYIDPRGDVMKKAMEKKLQTADNTYFISNIAKVDFEEEHFDYLDSYLLLPNPFLKSVDYYLMTYKDLGQMAEVKSDRNTGVLEKVRDKLSELGIASEIKEFGLHRADRLDVSQLMEKE